MGKKLTTEEFIKRVKQVHGDRYDYSKVEYINAQQKVCIICPEHGEFWQNPFGHLSGRGCKECGKPVKSFREYVQAAKRVHGNKYNYLSKKVEVGRTYLLIVCPIHGEFWQRSDHHLQGQGCPKCLVSKRILTKRKNNTFNVSGLQTVLYSKLKRYFGEDDVLLEHNQDERYPFNCDFYIKSLDLFIELNGFWTHGEHWFDKMNPDDIERLERWKEKESKFYDNAIETWTQRDVKKREYARKNNLNYVVFWGNYKNKNVVIRQIDDWFNDGCPIRQDWK